MLEKKKLLTAVVIGLLLLLFSVQYMAIGSGTDNDPAAGSISSGIVSDNLTVYLPSVINIDIEYFALMALYDSADGTNWYNNTGWGTANPHCDWYGVTCDAGHVTSLILYNNDLHGTIPPELGNLSSLEVLDLNNGGLSGPIPPELGTLGSLVKLDLHINQLSGPIPSELGNLSSLVELYLFQNQLSGPIPAELGNLSSLVELWLTDNQLSGAIPPELDNLSSLEILDLGYNGLSGPIPTELGNLSRLEQLGLPGNQLSGAIPAELGNLSRLQRLNLRDNPSIWCWETEEALNWAKGLNDYLGPVAVCP